MSEEPIKVEVQAVTGQAADKLTELQREMAATFASMHTDLAKLGADSMTGWQKVGAAIAPAGDKLTALKQEFASSFTQMRTDLVRLAQAAKTESQSIQSSLNGITPTLQSLAFQFAGLYAGVLTVNGLKDALVGAVKHNLDYAESIRGMARQMGTTTEAASILTAQLTYVGLTQETYLGMSQRFNRQLRTSEENMNLLGIKTRDTGKHLLSQEQLMQNALQTMLSYKDGIDRNMYAQYAFGRSASEALKLLELDDDAKKRGIEIAQKYGLVVGRDLAEATEAYSRQLNMANMVFDGMNLKIGQILLPTLVQLAGWWSSVGPTAIKVMEVAVKALMTAFDTLFYSIRLTFDTGVMLCTEFKDAVVYLATAFKVLLSSAIEITMNRMLGFFAGIKDGFNHVMRGDLSGAVDAFSAHWAEAEAKNFAVGEKMNADLVENNKSTFKKMSDTAKEYVADQQKLAKGFVERNKTLWQPGAPTPPKAAPQVKGEKTFKEPLGHMAEWNEELARLKDEEQNILGFSRAQEVAFWESKMAIAVKGGDATLKISREVNTKLLSLRRQAAKERFDEEMALIRLEIANVEDNGEAKIAAQEKILKRLQETHQDHGSRYVAELNKLETDKRAHDDKIRSLRVKEIADTKEHKLMLLAIDEQQAQQKDDSTGLKDIPQQRALAATRYEIDREALQATHDLDKTKLGQKMDLNRQLEALHRAHIDKLRTLDEAGARQDEQLELSRIASAAMQANSQISLKADAIQREVSLGAMGFREEAEGMRGLAQEKYAIDIVEQTQRLNMLAKQPLEQAKVNRRIEQLGQQHTLAMQKIGDKESQGYQKMAQGLFAPMGRAFSEVTTGILRGTTTWKAAVRNAGVNMLVSYVDTLAQMTLQWAATETAKTVATAMGATTRTAIEQEASLATMAGKAYSAIASIMADAWKAFAGAFSAMVGIPYVGPIVAPAAGAAAFAAVAGVASNVMSAEGGWDVDRDQLTNVHKQEMILPATYAERIRNMTDAGGTSSKVGGGVNFTVHAVDSQSVERLFAKNGDAIAKVIKQQMRNHRY